MAVIPETRSSDNRPGFDMDGLLLSAIGFSALVFAIIEGSSLGWWQPLEDLSLFGMTWSTDKSISIVPVLLIVAAVALTLFVLWERHRVTWLP